MKIFKLFILFLFLFFVGCNKNYVNLTKTDACVNCFIGVGSEYIYTNSDIYEVKKIAQTRALNDLIQQIQVKITSESSLYNGKYTEDIRVVSSVIIKRWREIETWEENGMIWSKVAVDKHDYYSGMDEYVQDITSKIKYNLDMMNKDSISIRDRLYFGNQALEYSEKLGIKNINNTKFIVQNLVDSIKIVSESICSLNVISCINANVYLYGIIDNSIDLEWFLQNNKFVGGLKIGEIKNKLIQKGICFPTVVVDSYKANSIITIKKGDYESLTIPKMRVDTIYTMDDNGIIVNRVQIADTTTLRNSKFFLRKKFGNKYCLFDGIRQSGSKLSVFKLPDGKKPLHFARVKFYRKEDDNLNNDIEEVYFDDNYIYVENIIRICYINENGILDYINMISNAYSPITVLSEPEGAQVFINNEYVGETPYYLSSSKEPYIVIRVRKKGYYVLEYFASLLSNEGITKKFVLMKMPKVYYGSVYLEPNSYYAEDSSSLNNLNEMISKVDNDIKMLAEGNIHDLSNNFQNLYMTKRFLNQYKTELDNRIYRQYFSAYNLNIEKGVHDVLLLRGKFDIPINEIENVKLNLDECYLKMEYKREGNHYRYVALSLLYGKREYLFNGKFSFK